MKKLLFILAFSLFIIPSLAFAQEFPSFPMSFYGRAELNGDPLPAGSKIQVFSNGILKGEAVVDANGYYGENNPTKSRLILTQYSGEELVFKYIFKGTTELSAGDSSVKYIGSFKSGEAIELDLPFIKSTQVSVTPNSSNSGSNGGGGGGGGATVIPVIPVVENLPPAILNKLPEPIIEKKTEVLGEKIVNYSAFSSLFGLDKELAESVSLNESENITAQTARVRFSGKNKDIYDKIISNNSSLSEKEKIAIAYFIQSGTPTTKRLGAGEQAGALSSYMSAFNKAPNSVAEWQDVIKIANGRWPSQKSQTAEDKAAIKFKKIYSRAPDMKNPNDNAAVTVMAYGLRPANRNTNSEKAAIKSFKAIFKYNPTSAIDWDIVRAIAYSGAKR